MEKENSQASQKPKQPLTDDDFANFLKTLKAMCPGDYESPESALVMRATISFEMFDRKGWTSDELKQVLERFTRIHQSRDWYPRTFLEHHEEIFGIDRMVL